MSRRRGAEQGTALALGAGALLPMILLDQKAAPHPERVHRQGAGTDRRNGLDRTRGPKRCRSSQNRQTLSRILALPLLGCYKIPDVTGLKKVSKAGRDLSPEVVMPLLLGRSHGTGPHMVGLPYRYLDRCGSTNAVLKAEAASSPTGTLVIADEQTEGRGRLGRAWTSQAGKDLVFSVLLRPTLPPEQVALLPLAAGLATAEVLDALPGLGGRSRVKWPNDVLLGGKKVCGILLESSVRGSTLDWVVVGVGLNVNSDPAATMRALTPAQMEEWKGRPQPTSLAIEMGNEVARGPLLADLLIGLSRWCAQPDPLRLLGALTARDALLGLQVEVFAGPPGDSVLAVGEAAGIGCAGELLVREAGGRTVGVVAGEVTVRTTT